MGSFSHVGSAAGHRHWLRQQKARSPGAGCPNDLLAFLHSAREQGASTVIRWGPVIPGYERAYDGLARKVYDWGFGSGRFTVDLLRYSKRHPEMEVRTVSHVGGGQIVGVDQITPADAGFEFRAHKWQETPEIQRAHLERVRGYFPNAHITVCKMQPSIAIQWIKEGLIKSFPCACWL